MPKKRPDGLRADGHICVKVPDGIYQEFRAWCRRSGMSHVDAFRLGFSLLHQSCKAEQAIPATPSNS